MSYVRANKAEINNALDDISDLIDNLNKAKSEASTFCNSAKNFSSGWVENTTIVNNWVNNLKNSGSYKGNNSYGHYDDSSGLKVWVYDEEALIEVAKGKIRSGKACYDDMADYLFSPGDTNGDAQSVQNSFEKIQNAIINFDGTIPSLEEAINDVNGGSGTDGFDFEGTTITIDGENVEIQTYVYVDEDGNTYTVAEMVNAFYTYVGITLASDLALAYTSGLSGENLESLLSANVSSNSEWVNSSLSKHFYSVASMSGISAMYEDATGKTYDADYIYSEYSSYNAGYVDLDKFDDFLSGLTNASAIGAMAMVGSVSGVYNDGFSNVDNGAVDAAQTRAVTDGTPSVGSSSGSSGSTSSGLTVDSFDNSSSSTADNSTDSNGSNDSSSDDVTSNDSSSDSSTEEKTDGATQEEANENPISDETAESILKSIDEVSNYEIPNTVESTSMTSSDVDSLVRDQYYSETSVDGSLTTDRLNLMDEFDSMSTEEKISVFEDMGYSTSEATTLANDSSLGQTAYVLGKQEETLASMSNEAASSLGVTNHDTIYDDGHSVSYIESGAANVDLTASSSEVLAARTTLETAKTDYDSAVTTANTSIAEANTAAENYNTTLSTIESNSGSDPTKWTTEEVEQYNAAATAYNDAVEKAQSAVSEASSAQATYETAKSDYETVYKESVLDAMEAANVTSYTDPVTGTSYTNGSVTSSTDSSTADTTSTTTTTTTTTTSSTDISDGGIISGDGSTLSI